MICTSGSAGIKAARGRILDANGKFSRQTARSATISVIHSQIEEPEAVIAMLVKSLEFPEETARKQRGEAVFNRACVKTNVDKETGDTIRSYGYAGVKVDEDFKRYYPKGSWRRALSASPEAIIRASSDWRWNMRKF